MGPVAGRELQQGEGAAEGRLNDHDLGQVETEVIALVCEPGHGSVRLNVEVKVDPEGLYLYAHETMARTLIRYEIVGGGLGPKEVVAEYMHGVIPDGFEFDAEGGVWIVSVASNRIIHVDRTGAQTIVTEDADHQALDALNAAFDAGEPVREMIEIGGRRKLGNIASICFGGEDLHTVYMGALAHDAIQTFRAPIKGAPLPHWGF